MLQRSEYEKSTHSVCSNDKCTTLHITKPVLLFRITYNINSLYNTDYIALHLFERADSYGCRKNDNQRSIQWVTFA